MINLQLLFSTVTPILIAWGAGYFFALDKSMTDYVGWKNVIAHPSGSDEKIDLDFLADSNWLHFRRLTLAAEMARVSSNLKRRLNLFFGLSAGASGILVLAYFVLHVACPTDLCKQLHGLEDSTMRVLIVLPAFVFSSYYYYNLIWLRRRTGVPKEFV